MPGKVSVKFTVDADLLREARILAPEERTSVSGLLRSRLEELVRRHRCYDLARRRALLRLRTGYDLQWTPTRPRDAVHER